MFDYLATSRWCDLGILQLPAGSPTPLESESPPYPAPLAKG